MLNLSGSGTTWDPVSVALNLTKKQINSELVIIRLIRAKIKEAKKEKTK